jgi:DNA-binding beta-propeller fold protein YncE
MAAAMGIWALSFATGCGNFWVYPGSLNNGSTSTGDYVYVANQITETLAGYVVGTGTLTAISGLPRTLGFTPTSLVVNPANTMVFVAGTSLGVGYIDTFQIGTGGVLSLLMTNQVGVADEVSMDVSPDGQWLIGLDANGLTLDEYQITSTTASTGQLTLGTATTYTFPSGAGSVVPGVLKFAPNGNYVYAAEGTAGDLLVPFSTSSGTWGTPQTLKLLSGSGTADNALAVSSNSGYLYVAQSGTNAGLAVFTIGSSNGQLTQVGSPLPSGTHPTSVVVNTAGTDIYVANQASGSISEYSVASNGTVAALSPASVNTTSAPWALAVDNSGKYLLAASQAGSPDLAMYSYSSGQLVLVTSTTTGTDPTGAVALATTH